MSWEIDWMGTSIRALWRWCGEGQSYEAFKAKLTEPGVKPRSPSTLVTCPSLSGAVRENQAWWLWVTLG